MSYHLTRPLDYARHNEEVRQVWAAYHAGHPTRVPVTIGGSIRNLFQNPELNTTGYSFRDFFEDPEAQIACQLHYQRWVRYNLYCDREMGPPAAWSLSVDFQNSYEAGWFGCPLTYEAGHVPDTLETLRDEKRRLYDLAAPDPLRGGLLGRAREFFEFMQERCRGLAYEGAPVTPPTTIPGEGTDGPFTVACKMRGTTELMLDMLEDPAYYHDLMGFLTDHIIRRIKALREWRWDRTKTASEHRVQRGHGWGYADDSVAMLSARHYEEFVMPYHQRLLAEFNDGSPVSIHLCGDATHLFPLLQAKLNVQSFDTGFPVDFGRLRRELGPGVQILGGPSVMRLQAGPPAALREEVRRVCESGIMAGGKFILREGNNMAPCTPVEHVEAMYEAGREFGRYPAAG